MFIFIRDRETDSELALVIPHIETIYLSNVNKKMPAVRFGMKNGETYSACDFNNLREARSFYCNCLKKIKFYYEEYDDDEEFDAVIEK